MEATLKSIWELLNWQEKRRVLWHFFEDGKERLVVTKEDYAEKLKKREELKKKKADWNKKKSPYERRGA